MQLTIWLSKKEVIAARGLLGVAPECQIIFERYIKQLGTNKDGRDAILDLLKDFFAELDWHLLENYPKENETLDN